MDYCRRFLLSIHTISRIVSNRRIVTEEYPLSRRTAVAVFRYAATYKNREDHEESGTVVAKDTEQAKQKLKQLDFNRIRLQKMGRVAGFLKSLRADVK